MTTARVESGKPGARPGAGRRRPAARRRWKRYAALAVALPLLAGGAATVYFYRSFSRQIDARLSGETERADPRIFARAFELRRAQAFTPTQIVERLNDLGYSNRPHTEQPGEFTIGRDAVVLMPRDGDHKGQLVRVVFAARRGKGAEPATIDRIELPGTRKTTDRVMLDPPLITALVTEGREKRRDVPLAAIPPRMVQAVLAIEDRRFYEHPGIDPIGLTSAVLGNLFGSRKYLRGGSTITQQLVKNTFLTPEKTLKRKVSEWFMSVALTRRLTKDQVLTLYLNDVALGQRGSFAIHGVPEAARLFFSKDVANVTLSEAATIAGVIQSPSRLSPFNNPDRAKERRNVVLQAMADAGYIPADAAMRAAREPLQLAPRALDAEAPYFVDYISQELQDRYKGSAVGAVDVYTTLDLHMQRIAQDAVRDGLARVDELLAKRKRQRAQAALLAIDPRNGEVLALIGGRSYNQSQFNRVLSASRQPGSVFKPFVYLAAFEKAYADGRADLTPATVVVDEPTTFMAGDQPWTPANYDGRFQGPLTLRRALALSRNIPAVKVAEAAGYEEVAALWRRVGAGTVPKPYPSIALGVFEATPFQIASAYTLFPNGGTLKPLHAITRMSIRGKEIPVQAARERTVARRDTTYLVTNMLRSVLNEGTGAGARAAGFALDAAGKSGTTNDLRDAWFVGFTPELLTVVWVGLDDNMPLGLSGTQAALPIWTTFMMRALAGRPSLPFGVPEGLVYVDIDRDTGKVAGPDCLAVVHEAFIAGTEPTELCTFHES
ncbi:MAG: PBP1A family penicillin-binding protein [Acidobacteriota bacterium]